MFERFVAQSRKVIVLSQEEARQLHHQYIGTEHLLLAMAIQQEGAAADALHEHGLTVEVVREQIVQLIGDDLDSEALATLGINLDAVREATEAAFGPGALSSKPGKMLTGHIPFSKRAKKVLELSLREALRLQQDHIGTGHILLGLIREGEGLAAQVITRTGVDLEELREDVVRRLGSQAA
jgi:ATP-dependent Clp protease ATP-binding subunit ClpA